ncbi:MAG: peptidylprolyl isomerase [Vallitalea sp.]|jgi:foldase protein PrsA|nr:peptidylprolyl isomerase [Vallitalea sp.]
MKNFKKLISAIMIFSMVAVLFAGCGKKVDTKDNEGVSSENEGVSGEGKVVSTVNGDEISLGEVNLYLRQMEAYFERFGSDIWDQPSGEEGKTLVDIAKENALNAAQNATIISLLAKDKGVEVTDEQAEEADKLAHEFMDKFDKEIAKKDGITLEVIKKILNNQALAQAFFDEEMKDFEADEEELNSMLEQSDQYKGYKENGHKYYVDQVRARHILFSTRDDSNQPVSDEKKAEIKEKAEEVLAKVKAGEDFATLAKEYSEDPGSKEKGGEYTFKRGEMVTEFEETAFNMKDGEVSELVETAFGYHIIKLEEHIDATDAEIQAEEAKEKNIVEEAKKQLMQKAFDGKFEEWKKDYEIVVNDEVWSTVEVRQARNQVKDNDAEETKADENKDEEQSNDETKSQDEKDGSDDKEKEE